MAEKEITIYDEIGIFMEGLQQQIDSLRFHACMSGDCPHYLQSECDETLKLFLEEIKKPGVARLEMN